MVKQKIFGNIYKTIDKMSIKNNVIFICRLLFTVHVVSKQMYREKMPKMDCSVWTVDSFTNQNLSWKNILHC